MTSEWQGGQFARRSTVVKAHGQRVASSVVEVIFGDRIGLTLFLGSLVLSVLTWRVGNFFNDVSLSVLMIEHLSRGQVSLGPVETVDRVAPGMQVADGFVYGRHYGIVLLSLPLYWVFEGLQAVTDLRLLVLLGWTGSIVAVVVLVAEQFDRWRAGLAIGSALGLAALLANAPFLAPFPRDSTAILALQATTILVGAFTGVLVYRLCSVHYERRVACIGGIAAVLGTPIWFWTTIPKRHALTAVLVLATVYAFTRSRSERNGSSRLNTTGFRALAYASAGVLVWVNAVEGFTLFAALVVVDVPTAPANRPRDLALVGSVFLLSLVPFFVSNLFVTGNPFKPPMFMRPIWAVDIPTSPPAEATGATGAGTGAEMESVEATAPPATPPTSPVSSFSPVDDLRTLVFRLRKATRKYWGGLAVIAAEPMRLFTTFVRWGRHGYAPGNVFFGNGTNLSVLESAPVLGALAALPLYTTVRSVGTRTQSVRAHLTPTDLLVIVYAGLLVILFINRLPTRVQITVRYLHPLYPLLVYAVIRQIRVREVLNERTISVLRGYLLSLLVGLPLAVLGLLLADVTKGDVFQFYGLCALTVTAVLAISVLLSRRSENATRVAAISFGVAVALATIFTLLTAFVVMHFGPSALPVVESVTGDLRFAILT